ncbi:MAG: hypothetical protein ABIL19_01860 [candidate division WOR-3 bacterium]
MVRALGWVLLIGLYLLSLFFKFSGNPIALYSIGFLTIYVSVVWFLKGYVELGLDNVRGQFYVIMSIAFLLHGLSFFFAKLTDIFTFGLMGIILITIARFFFFAGNFRYIWFFQSSGYYLTFTRLIIVLVVFSILFAATFYIPNLVDIFKNMSPYVLFIILDWVMVFIVIYNLLLLWGTEIGKKWAIGAFVVSLFLFGDATFIAQINAIYPYVLWATADTLMAVIALLRG